jgi:hypothetical protein
MGWALGLGWLIPRGRGAGLYPAPGDSGQPLLDARF